jgi:hypothetical protein
MPSPKVIEESVNGIVSLVKDSPRLIALEATDAVEAALECPPREITIAWALNIIKSSFTSVLYRTSID